MIIRGKNVCVFFLLGMCKFGNAKCNYSHSKAALPPVGWWTCPKKRAERAEELNQLGKSGFLKARLAKPKGPNAT
jgi:CCCH-type zinc finger